MKVSFAITTHNEKCVSDLLGQLQEHIEGNSTGDEVVILDDYSSNPDTVYILETYSRLPYMGLYGRQLDRDFGAQKNYLNALCKGEYIFQIDADEFLSPGLLSNLHEILAETPENDLFYVPRINVVEGLTQAHVDQWGWSVNEDGWIMWPDFQTRLYKNKPEIVWAGKVHERIVGFETYIYLPEDEVYAIFHRKEIARQEEQNALYDQIARNGV